MTGVQRLAEVFDAGRRQGRPLVFPFVTAGYPELESTVPVALALAESGADVLEIGIPFSDPLADGPTIQRSSERALRNGMSVARVLEQVEELRARGGLRIPIVLMGYCNPLYALGMERFAAAAAAAGVDGMIVPDLPPEEAAEYRSACDEAGLAAIFLVAPNAPDDRVRIVDEASSVFSYCVSVTGVTGARGSVEDRTVEFLARVRRIASKPFVVGFGIKTPEQVRRLGPLADGVVVGSALLDALRESPGPAAAAEIVRGLRTAADEVANSEDRRW